MLNIYKNFVGFVVLQHWNFHKKRPLSFTRWCRDIIQVRWKTPILLCEKFIQDTLTKFYRNCASFAEDMTKHFGLLFSWTRRIALA